MTFLQQNLATSSFCYVIHCFPAFRGAQKEDPERAQFGSKIVAIRDVLRKIHSNSNDQSLIFILFPSFVN